tara:strand:+ start:402 stop:575 length:174 start_codon:yes stop_codon:yes gene_type:complete
MSVDYSGIPNARDLKIKDVMKKYGKDKDGNYKNPTKLIENLPRAKKLSPRDKIVAPA